MGHRFQPLRARARADGRRRGALQALIAVVVVATLPLAVSSAATAAPANDAFDAAVPIGIGAVDSGTVTGSNVGASSEPGEPVHAGTGGGATVWWSWTAPDDGRLDLSTSGSSFDTVLAVYRGPAVQALTEQAANDDRFAEDPSGASKVTGVIVQRGVRYSIAVAGHGAATGSVELTWILSRFAGPAGDAFAAPEELVQDAAYTWRSFDTQGATKELTEPAHAGNAGGASSWFRWVAPASGTLVLSTTGSSFDTLLAIYTGSQLSSLTTVAANDNANPQNLPGPSRLELTVTAGTIYRFVIDGVNGAFGHAELNVSLTPVTPAAPYAPRDVLAFPASGQALVTWTPPEATGSGPLTGYVVTPYLGATALAPTTGTTTAGRAVVSGLANGQAYTFRVAVRNAATVGPAAPASAAITPTATPPNDPFAGATALVPASGGTATGRLAGATKEPLEPAHAGDAGGRSLWWSWTAPSAGTVALSTSGSEADTLLAVYTGATVGALTPIAANDDAKADGTSRLEATVQAGTVYRIAVDGYGSPGSIRLDWQFAAAVPPAPAPGTPRITTAVADNGQVNLVWSAPAKSGGSPITGYVVRTTTGGNTLTPRVLTGTGTTTTITGLTNGTTYSFRVSATNALGTGGQSGAASAEPTTAASDAFAAAPALLPATGGSVAGTTVAATDEAGEPDHLGFSTTHSVWLRWTAPYSGSLAMEVTGPTFQPAVLVYTGTSVGALTLVAQGQDPEDPGVYGGSIPLLPVTAGTTYRLAVIGQNGTSGPFDLTWESRDTTAPVASLSQPASRWTLSTSVSTTWSATDTGSGVASYDVYRARGSWNAALSAKTTWLAATTARSQTFTGSYGSTYCLSVSALDRAGNRSTTTPSRCTAIPLPAANLTYGSGWARQSISTAYTGIGYRTTTLKATVTRSSIVAKRIALVATTCPTCGSVKVSWNGTSKKTISLTSSSTVRKRVIELLTFGSSTTGTLSLQVSTSGKPVVIEGLAISKSGT